MNISVRMSTLKPMMKAPVTWKQHQQGLEDIKKTCKEGVKTCAAV